MRSPLCKGRGSSRSNSREVPRVPQHLRGHAPTQPLHLAPAQRKAYEAIRISIRKGGSDIFLLHGVTGSGKTEVYLQAVCGRNRTGRDRPS